MIRIRGQFDEIDRWVEKFGKLGEGLPESMNRQAGEAVLTEVKLGFRESKDPFGKPWAPLKHRQGKPLRDTGRLGNSFDSFPTATGFQVLTDVEYAGVHQFGTPTIPARKMLPEDTLPPAYEDAIRGAIEIGWEQLWGG